MAMVLATVLGWSIFKVAARRWGEETADLPMTLDSPVDPEVDHIRGPEDARLTLVEFVDFECPYCAHATGSWEDLHGRFGDDLRYVVRHLPHHPHGPFAARAAEAAAKQEMFWPWLDFVFTRQHARRVRPGHRHPDPCCSHAHRYQGMGVSPGSPSPRRR